MERHVIQVGAVGVASFLLAALCIYAGFHILAAVNFFVAGFNTAHVIFRITLIKEIERQLTP